MPEYMRALAVVIIMAAATFAFFARPARRIIDPKDFRRWVGLWFIVTILAFLAGNFWIYTAAATVIVLALQRSEPLRPALYLLLLLAVPQVSQPIPGLGIINYFFYLTHDRMLALLILLPAFVSLMAGVGRKRRRWLATDSILFLYYALVVILTLRGTSLTDTSRTGVMLFLGMILPYFVFSRSLGSREDIRRVMLAYLLPILALATIGGFEMAKGWHLYSSVTADLGDNLRITYLGRAGALRATTTAAGSIVFGYTMMIGLGFLFAFSKQYLNSRQRIMAFTAISLGLISSLSRGPWVGAVVLVLIFHATGRRQARTIARLGFFFAIILAIISQTAIWNKIIGLIPFVGKIETENIDYRVRLIENAWTVIQRNPWFGSIDYLVTEEMQSMIQGQGIADIVNSYIGVALAYGLVGLALFTGFFILVIRNLRRAYRSLPANEEDFRRTGRALLATLAGVLVSIGTTSSMGATSMLYWSLAGIAVAYARVVRRLLSGRAEADSHEMISRPQNYG